ncbi:MAG TPA: hypothetical protein VN939_05725 [Chthoniobacterales bacterium]|nr:hypothetical protein [Chthoniobacterales bacterium]
MISFIKATDRCVLGALIAIEMLAGYNFYCREVAWYPPGNWDQAPYLAASYRMKERILTNGVGQLANIIRSPYNTGLALPILGAVSGLFFAGSRLPVLLVPFLGFALLQVCAFATGQAVWRSRTYGYMLVGLILCLNTPWYWVGGVFDFRYDFMAYSLYGIWACTVIQSNLFLNRRWAIASGLIGAFLVLSRFLTLIYLLGVSAGFGLLCIAVIVLRRGDKELTRRMWRRFFHVLLSSGVMAILVAPFLIFSWQYIFQYYGVGHLLGGAGWARSRQAGIASLAERLLFYPKSVLGDHWEIAFVLGGAIVLIGSMIAAITRSQKTRDLLRIGRDEIPSLQILFLLGAILEPIIVLTIDPDKNSMAGGIIGVPVALLLVSLSARITAVREFQVPALPRTVIACALAVVTLGVSTVFDRLSRHTPEYAERNDLTRLLELNKWMVSYASDRGWQNPGISVDTISSWFNGDSITDTGYEEMGKFIDFHLVLGRDSLGADRQEAFAQVAQSDFLILTAGRSQVTTVESGNTSPSSLTDATYQWFSVLRRLSPHYQPDVQPASAGIALEGSTASLQRWPTLRQHLYPFYQRLALYRDDLKAWADKNMSLAKTVPFENFTVTVYVRSTADVSSVSDNNH